MNSIVHVDVNNPIDEARSGVMVILSGDAPVWRYCQLFYEAIEKGATVVAIGHGVDVTVDADLSVAAYSADPEFKVGEPVRIGFQRHDDAFHRREAERIIP